MKNEGTGSADLAKELMFVKCRLAHAEKQNSELQQANHVLQCELNQRESTLKALVLSESKYRSIFEEAAIGIGMVSFTDARWLKVNAAFCRMLGYTAEQLYSTPWPEITHPDDLELDLVPFRQMAAGKLENYAVEKRFRHHDGHLVWARLTLSLVRDVQGRPDFEIAVIEGITERKQAEQALAHERAFLEAVLQASPAAIIVANANGKLVRMNPANERLWGMAPFSERVSEYRIWKGWWADGSERHGKPLAPEEWAMARALRGEVCPGDVVEIEPFDQPNTRRTMINSGAPVRNRAGEILGAVIAQMDITKPLQTEQALRQSERRLRVFFESDMVGTIYWTVDGGITDANNKFLRMLGYSRDDLQNGELRWAEMTPIEYEHLDENALHELITTGVVTPYEKEFIRKDGTRIPVIIGAAMLDEQRNAGVAFVLDNTERKKAEEGLRAAKDELLRINEELEKRIQERTATLQEALNELEHFSYTITHDMRAPLRAMQGFSQILLSKSDTAESPEQAQPPLRRDLLRRISSAAKRMDQLITDALQYNTTVRAECKMEPVDLPTLLHGILETYPNFHSEGAEISLEGEFPMVLGNEAALTQCFSNLLGNAVKFVQPGQIPKVKVWAEDHPGVVRIWIEDNGIGIPQDALERIWLMFQVIDKRHDGTGIGLALVRKVVERMGGRTGAESTVGKGSRFWVELKRASTTVNSAGIPDAADSGESLHQRTKLNRNG